MRGLAGKAFLVTGSSEGIGYAIAERLVASGARVMIHGIDTAAVEVAVRDLGLMTNGVVGDLADAGTASAIILATVTTFGRIDGLVNNAGIYPRGALGGTTVEFFDRVLAINTRAPLLCAEAAIRAFRHQESGGAIVSIGSINALSGQHDLTVYSMSKGALNTMTRNLADALAPERIRVNCLNAGWTFTANEDATQQGQGREAGWQTRLSARFAPRGEIMKPHEIAAHAAFWLSDDSAPVSGQVYEVEQYPMVGRMWSSEH